MLKFAWKNILFYKGRSITTFLLTFISAMLFIVFVSMNDGSHNSMLSNALKVYGGGIEIYHKEYREKGGNEYLINDVNTIKEQLSTIEGITRFSSRYETFGLLSYKDYSTASMVVGVEPKQEEYLSMLKDTLVEGEYLSENSRNVLYIGSGVAKRLHVKVGDEISFIGGASDNSFAADLFIIGGIFTTGSFEFDSTASFVNRTYFDTLMLSDNKASYITVQVQNLEDVDKINEEIVSVIDTKSLESLTWKTLMKTMVEAMEVDSIFGYISLGLFLMVIFFVIMIYGFINVSTRIREFGVLRCLGLGKANVFSLLLYEIIILSSLAIALATPIAGYICYYYSINPIIIEGIAETYKDYGVISDELPFHFDLFTIFWNVAVVYILNILSVVYPYFHIYSFRPIEASKHV